MSFQYIYMYMKTDKEYYKEIKHLATKVKGYFQLREDERETACNDAFLHFHKALIEGRVVGDNSNYEDYKMYMYVIIKSWVNQRFASNKRYKNLIFRDAFSLDFDDFNDSDKETQSDFKDEYSIKHSETQPDIETYLKVKKALDALPPHDRAIYRWYTRGWSCEYMHSMNLNKHNSTSSYHYLINKIRDILKRVLNDTPPKSTDDVIIPHSDFEKVLDKLKSDKTKDIVRRYYGLKPYRFQHSISDIIKVYDDSKKKISRRISYFNSLVK